MSSTAKDWWKNEGSRRPGPSRIRVTLSRPLTPAETEHLLATLGSNGDKVRVNGNRIWYESTVFRSRVTYQWVAYTVASSFVNAFPTAVRTFRELERVVGVRSYNDDYSFEQAIRKVHVR